MLSLSHRTVLTKNAPTMVRTRTEEATSRYTRSFCVVPTLVCLENWLRRAARDHTPSQLLEAGVDFLSNARPAAARLGAKHRPNTTFAEQVSAVELHSDCLTATGTGLNCTGRIGGFAEALAVLEHLW